MKSEIYTIVGVMTEKAANEYIRDHAAPADQFYLRVNANKYDTLYVIVLVHQKYNKYIAADIALEISDYYRTQKALV